MAGLWGCEEREMLGGSEWLNCRKEFRCSFELFLFRLPMIKDAMRWPDDPRSGIYRDAYLQRS